MPSHPFGMLKGVDENLTAEQLEQLARSVAMSPSLGQTDRQHVIDALRRFAEVERRRGDDTQCSTEILDIGE